LPENQRPDRALESPFAKKFVLSKPKNIALGGAFFSTPFPMIFRGHVKPNGSEMSFSPYYISQRATEDIRFKTRSQTVFISPALMIEGRSKSMVPDGVTDVWDTGFWRASRPNEVAFPVIIELPLEESRNALEIVLKVKSSSCVFTGSRN
jgi:hypothetical protein